MRIVLVGTVAFSQHCLEEVLRNGGDVVGVLTLNEEDGAFHSDYVDLQPICRDFGIPCYTIGNINSERTIKRLKSLNPYLIFVFGWSQIVGKKVRNIPPMGCIGTHPTLLPKNRGRHPLIWTLVHGLGTGGLTFFYLDQKADAGDIVWQEAFPVTRQDDAMSLYSKIEGLASKAIADFLPKLETDTADRVPQDSGSATYWKKRGEEDGKICWNESSKVCYDLIRALTHPYVGAHTFVDGRKIKIWKAEIGRGPLLAFDEELLPGSLFGKKDSRYNVRTADGYLTILDCDVLNGGLVCIEKRFGDEK